MVSLITKLIKYESTVFLCSSGVKRETQKQKRRREKRQSLQDPLSPDTKRAREDHGWDGVGDTYRRQILKPVS